nr:hypothetical protein CFP56_28028 [Quercus suber]
MESAKNKQATKNKQEEIKKAAALRAQVGDHRPSPLMPPRRGSTPLMFNHRDADMDECLEHKTDPLNDSSLHDIMRGLVRMRALQIRCSSCKASIKHLKKHLESR